MRGLDRRLATKVPTGCPPRSMGSSTRCGPRPRQPSVSVDHGHLTGTPSVSTSARGARIDSVICATVSWSLSSTKWTPPSAGIVISRRHLLEQVTQSEPTIRLARDDPRPQRRLARVEPNQEVVVRTQGGEHVGEMCRRLDDLGDNEQHPPARAWESRRERRRSQRRERSGKGNAHDTSSTSTPACGIPSSANASSSAVSATVLPEPGGPVTNTANTPRVLHPLDVTADRDIAIGWSTPQATSTPTTTGSCVGW